MAALADSINYGVKWVYSAWDENAATGGAIVFIPCLLVAASLFPQQIVYLDANTPCYWLFVDAVILCFTIAVLAAFIDFAADLYCFFAQVPGDSVPMIAGKDNTHEYPTVFSNAIFWALIIRVIGSAFILLVLTTAVSFALLPFLNTPSYATANNTIPSVPPQCDLLSSKVYHFKLFFGFAVVAVVFAGLRFACVHQSRPNLPPGQEYDRDHDHHHHHPNDAHGHHDNNDDHAHELAVVKTEDDKGRRHEESEEENSEDREDRKRRKAERKQKRAEKRKRREEEKGKQDSDEEGAKDDNESGEN